MLAKMLTKQFHNRKYTHISPQHQGRQTLIQHNQRRILVDWICELADIFKISSTTIHKSVCYLDTVLTTQNIPSNQWQLLAIMCLFLSAKNIELDQKVPSIKHVYECCKAKYSHSLIKQWENKLLAYLEWDLQVTTPIDILHQFLIQGIIFPNDHVFNQTGQKKPPNLNIAAYIGKYADFFADLTLQGKTSCFISFNFIRL
jgi:hypothetical protein